jgi:hypothetical protein
MRAGRLARVQPTHLSWRLRSTATELVSARFAGKCRGGGAALVASWQEGGTPWRAENPREDRLQPTANPCRQDERTPAQARNPWRRVRFEVPDEESRCVPRNVDGLDEGRENGLGSAVATPKVDAERQEGQAHREVVLAGQGGKPLKGKPHERRGMKQGRAASGGRKRQEAEKA